MSWGTNPEGAGGLGDRPLEFLWEIIIEERGLSPFYFTLVFYIAQEIVRILENCPQRSVPTCYYYKNKILLISKNY